MQEATVLPKVSSFSPAGGSDTVLTPTYSMVAASILAPISPMEGMSTFTLGWVSGYLEPSGSTTIIFPAAVSRRAVWNGSIPAATSTPRRTISLYLFTTSMKASIRVSTPASAVWESSSRVSDGFCPITSLK